MVHPPKISGTKIVISLGNPALCRLKHVYILSDKVKGSYVATLLQGTGYEIQWGTGNNKLVRKAFQWLLEQLGGTQLRRYSVSTDRKAAKSKTTEPEEAGWEFFMDS